MADTYSADTLGRDPAGLRQAFTNRLRSGGRILDAGSGSGRDTRAFLRAGFDVDAFDASREMARLSTDLTGQRTIVDRFERYQGPLAHYDGVWAFAALPHVREAGLPDAVTRLARVLKPGGWLFANFKVGRGERRDPRGRRFADLNPAALKALFEQTGGWDRIETTQASATAAFGDAAEWAEVFARRGRD